MFQFLILICNHPGIVLIVKCPNCDPHADQYRIQGCNLIKKTYVLRPINKMLIIHKTNLFWNTLTVKYIFRNQYKSKLMVLFKLDSSKHFPQDWKYLRFYHKFFCKTQPWGGPVDFNVNKVWMYYVSSLCLICFWVTMNG